MISPLWGYPKGECRRFLISRESLYASTYDFSRRTRRVGALPLSTTHVAEQLAEVFVAGPWLAEDLIKGGQALLNRKWRGLPALVDRLLLAFASGVRPTAHRVATFLGNDLKLRRANETKPFKIVTRVRAPAVMWPAPGRPSLWQVPAIVTPIELADRLDLSLRQLEWLADSQGRERRTPAGPHRRYDYRWVVKRSGRSRLVEIPRNRLRVIQRRLLALVVSQIPPHEAAHGFCPGRSVRTFVKPHVGRYVVLKLDLHDFFPTITAARLTSLFHACGYPEPVARLMTGLATNCVPSSVWNQPAAPISWTSQSLYRVPHLPQGAPTSPALANACCFALDTRLTGLAKASGASYTRYADDLAFSGSLDFAKSVGRFVIHASAIAIEEGFSVHPHKTRIMRQGVCQKVAGAVLNVRPNVARTEYETLKAILHNCIKHSPETQNRHAHPNFSAHLQGRISSLGSLNPDRGKRLRAIFDQISW